MNNVLSNINNVNVSVNEYVTKYSLNRNIKKLIDNDTTLKNKYNEVLSGQLIHDWSAGIEYNYCDLVWYKDENDELWLLRSMSEFNNNPPFLIVNNKKVLNDQYWKNENEYKTILDYGIEKTLQYYTRSLINEHQYDAYHKYGILSSEKDLKSKLLMNDFSNISYNRDTNFYPYKTFDILDYQPELSNVILNGYYREYHNGIIEYNIVYRVGYCGKVIYNGDEYDQISCNCIQFYNMNRLNKQSLDYNENNKYFNNTGDYQIFNYKNNTDKSISVNETTIEYNRNDYVNVYHAEIKFPIPFKNLNYMVYNTDLTQVKYDSMEISPPLIDKTRVEMIKQNKCKTVFCNKQKQSITALYITYPNDINQEPGWNATHGGLMSNTFRCHIIGVK